MAGTATTDFLHRLETRAPTCASREKKSSGGMKPSREKLRRPSIACPAAATRELKSSVRRGLLLRVPSKMASSAPGGSGEGNGVIQGRPRTAKYGSSLPPRRRYSLRLAAICPTLMRSEERRGGKEC